MKTKNVYINYDLNSNKWKVLKSSKGLLIKEFNSLDDVLVYLNKLSEITHISYKKSGNLKKIELKRNLNGKIDIDKYSWIIKSLIEVESLTSNNLNNLLNKSKRSIMKDLRMTLNQIPKYMELIVNNEIIKTKDFAPFEEKKFNFYIDNPYSIKINYSHSEINENGSYQIIFKGEYLNNFFVKNTIARVSGFEEEGENENLKEHQNFEVNKILNSIPSITKHFYKETIKSTKGFIKYTTTTDYLNLNLREEYGDLELYYKHGYISKTDEYLVEFMLRKEGFNSKVKILNLIAEFIPKNKIKKNIASNNSEQEKQFILDNKENIESTYNENKASANIISNDESEINNQLSNVASNNSEQEKQFTLDNKENIESTYNENKASANIISNDESEKNNQLSSNVASNNSEHEKQFTLDNKENIESTYNENKASANIISNDESEINNQLSNAKIKEKLKLKLTEISDQISLNLKNEIPSTNGYKKIISGYLGINWTEESMINVFAKHDTISSDGSYIIYVKILFDGKETDFFVKNIHLKIDGITEYKKKIQEENEVNEKTQSINDFISKNLDIIKYNTNSLLNYHQEYKQYKNSYFNTNFIFLKDVIILFKTDKIKKDGQFLIEWKFKYKDIILREYVSKIEISGLNNFYEREMKEKKLQIAQNELNDFIYSFPQKIYFETNNKIEPTNGFIKFKNGDLGIQINDIQDKISIKYSHEGIEANGILCVNFKFKHSELKTFDMKQNIVIKGIKEFFIENENNKKHKKAIKILNKIPKRIIYKTDKPIIGSNIFLPFNNNDFGIFLDDMEDYLMYFKNPDMPSNGIYDIIVKLEYNSLSPIEKEVQIKIVGLDESLMEKELQKKKSMEEESLRILFDQIPIEIKWHLEKDVFSNTFPKIFNPADYKIILNNPEDIEINQDLPSIFKDGTYNLFLKAYKGSSVIEKKVKLIASGIDDFILKQEKEKFYTKAKNRIESILSQLPEKIPFITNKLIETQKDFVKFKNGDFGINIYNPKKIDILFNHHGIQDNGEIQLTFKINIEGIESQFKNVIVNIEYVGDVTMAINLKENKDSLVKTVKDIIAQIPNSFEYSSNNNKKGTNEYVVFKDGDFGLTIYNPSRAMIIYRHKDMLQSGYHKIIWKVKGDSERYFKKTSSVKLVLLNQNNILDSNAPENTNYVDKKNQSIAEIPKEITYKLDGKILRAKNNPVSGSIFESYFMETKKLFYSHRKIKSPGLYTLKIMDTNNTEKKLKYKVNLLIEHSNENNWKKVENKSLINSENIINENNHLSADYSALSKDEYRKLIIDSIPSEKEYLSKNKRKILPDYSNKFIDFNQGDFGYFVKSSVTSEIKIKYMPFKNDKYKINVTFLVNDKDLIIEKESKLTILDSRDLNNRWRKTIWFLIIFQTIVISLIIVILIFYYS